MSLKKRGKGEVYFIFNVIIISNRGAVTKTTHSELPPEHGDPALGLLLAQTPFNGVEAVVSGQGDVPAANRRADGACQEVGLGVKADAHTISVHHSQGPIVAQLVAVPHLVCRGRETGIREARTEATRKTR